MNFVPMVGWALVSQADLDMTGSPKIYASSEHGRRHFCGDCGTGLFYTNAEMLPGIIDVQSATYDDPNAPFVIDTGLGLVDFALLPHMDHADHPESSAERVERMAAEVPVPTYGIDDQTAIKVAGGTVEVVSEGHWKLFSP